MPRIVLLVAFLSTVFSGCTQNNSANPGVAKSISKTMQPKEMGTLSEVFDSEVAQDDPAEQTAKDRLAETAMGISQDAKSLIKAGRYEDGYQLAKEAMRKFEADNDDLAWIILESIEAGDKRIDVHFNMGERERNFPDNGIVRPLSFAFGRLEKKRIFCKSWILKSVDLMESPHQQRLEKKTGTVTPITRSWTSIRTTPTFANE